MGGVIFVCLFEGGNRRWFACECVCTAESKRQERELGMVVCLRERDFLSGVQALFFLFFFFQTPEMKTRAYTVT